MEQVKSDREEGVERGCLRAIRLAILGSGRGSNLRAILDAIQSGSLHAEVVLVISDKAGSGILQIAQRAGVSALALDAVPYSESDLLVPLAECGADLIVLAGYMRIIKRQMLEAWPGRILNVHPSLLPKFPGLRAWRQALDAGESETGCTVHLVDSGVDSGPVLGQAKVPIYPGDDAAGVHARIQEAEHRLYPQVIADYGTKLLGAEKD